MKRRQFIALAGGGAGIAVTGGAVAHWLLRPSFAFEAVHHPAGFRRLPRGDGLSIGRILVGMEDTEGSRLQLADAELCDLAFGGRSADRAPLTIALFSDFFCPYCRVLDLQVRDIVAGDDRVALVPHEVPLLGRSSEFAARAAIAAARQGAYDAVHARLIRTTFVPNPAYLRSLAQEEGLDVSQFLADVQSAETTHVLEQSGEVFRAFGFAGTPALVVGRTLVNGAISRNHLRALIRLELAEQTPHPCL